MNLPTSLLALAARLPKAELHLHIEGTLEPELLFTFAKRNGVTLPYSSVSALREAYAFTNLQSFLDIYYAGAGVLLQEEDFYDMAMAYFMRAVQDGVVHCEIFFDPQTHTQRGVAFATVISGLRRACEDAKAQWGISGLLILCFLRHLPETEAFKTLKEALPYLQYVAGVGLDSSERGYPPHRFHRVFQSCRELGLRVVAHAGEEGPPEYIWQALDGLRVERVDHGVRCLEDATLVQRLVRERIPLTVCPCSNVKLCVVPNMAQHPLKRMLDAGLCVTINADDPAYFGGYLLDNFAACLQALPLTTADVITLAKNSIEASWLTPQEKWHWYDEIERLSVL